MNTCRTGSEKELAYRPALQAEISRQGYSELVVELKGEGSLRTF